MEVVSIYYENDQVVEEDQELQDFVKDVYVYGMRGKKASGRLQGKCASPGHEEQKAGDSALGYPPVSERPSEHPASLSLSVLLSVCGELR